MHPGNVIHCCVLQQNKVVRRSACDQIAHIDSPSRLGSTFSGPEPSCIRIGVCHRVRADATGKSGKIRVCYRLCQYECDRGRRDHDSVVTAVSGFLRSIKSTARVNFTDGDVETGTASGTQTAVQTLQFNREDVACWSGRPLQEPTYIVLRTKNPLPFVRENEGPGAFDLSALIQVGQRGPVRAVLV